MMLAAAGGAIAWHMWFLLIAAFALPWHDPVEFYFTTLNDMLVYTPGPFQSLFRTHPVLNDLVGIAMTALGTGVLANLGLPVAVLGGNANLAIAAPLAFFLGLNFNLKGPVSLSLSPHCCLSVWGCRPWHPGEEYRVLFWLAYWVSIAVVTTGTALWVAEKRELGLKS
jgi:hypothetical protein